MKDKLLENSINLLKQIKLELHGRSEVSLTRKLDEVIVQLEKLAYSNLEKSKRDELIMKLFAKGLILTNLARAIIALFDDAR